MARPYYIQLVREDAEEPMQVMTPMPAVTVYGNHVHCPTCGREFTNLRTDDPWEHCSYCGNIADLRAVMKRRGFDPPELPPAA